MFKDFLIKNYPIVTSFLTNAILKNKLANSYVFVTKEQENAFDIVANLAQILNCETSKNAFSAPCGVCINCKWLEKREHPQALITVSNDQTSKKEQIKIDTIRDLLGNLKTTSDCFRVIYFKNSNLNYLPPESCNLLLKTVEETPKNTVFIFYNTSKNDILPTIVSRSQLIYLNKTHSDLSKTIYSNTLPIKDISHGKERVHTNFEKAKKCYEYIEKHEIEPKEYLLFLALSSYKQNKNSNLKAFIKLNKRLSLTYQKLKSFVQLKIAIEDLFLEFEDELPCFD